MSTTTAAPAAKAGDQKPVEKKSVSKDLIKQLARGEEPKAKVEVKPPTVEETKAAADAEKKRVEDAAIETAAARVKKKPADLPAIPEAVTTAKPVTEAEVRKIVAEVQPAAQPAVKAEDQEDLNLATFAAQKFADRYAELPAKMTQWFGVRDQHLAAKAKELGGRDSPEFRDYVKSEDFQQFAKEHAPMYQRGDAKKVYEEYIKDQGAQAAIARMKPELDEVKRRQLEIEQAPIIQQKVGNALAAMFDDRSDDKDEALAEASKDLVAFARDNEVEGGVIVRHANFFRSAMEETLRITSGLVDISKGKPTDTQRWIEQFVEQQEGKLEKVAPNGLKMADGKILVSTSQMGRLREAKVRNLAEYRQLLPEEIVGMIAVEGQAEIKRQLRTEREKLAKSGYVRKPKEEGKKPVIPETPPSPMAAAAAAVGAAAAKPAKTEKWFQKYTAG